MLSNKSAFSSLTKCLKPNDPEVKAGDVSGNHFTEKDDECLEQQQASSREGGWRTAGGRGEGERSETSTGPGWVWLCVSLILLSFFTHSSWASVLYFWIHETIYQWTTCLTSSPTNNLLFMVSFYSAESYICCSVYCEMNVDMPQFTCSSPQTLAKLQLQPGAERF